MTNDFSEVVLVEPSIMISLEHILGLVLFTTIPKPTTYEIRNNNNKIFKVNNDGTIFYLNKNSYLLQRRLINTKEAAIESCKKFIYLKNLQIKKLNQFKINGIECLFPELELLNVYSEIDRKSRNNVSHFVIDFKPVIRINDKLRQIPKALISFSVNNYGIFSMTYNFRPIKVSYAK